MDAHYSPSARKAAAEAPLEFACLQVFRAHDSGHGGTLEVTQESVD